MAMSSPVQTESESDSSPKMNPQKSFIDNTTQTYTFCSSLSTLLDEGEEKSIWKSLIQHGLIEDLACLIMEYWFLFLGECPNDPIQISSNFVHGRDSLHSIVKLNRLLFFRHNQTLNVSDPPFERLGFADMQSYTDFVDRPFKHNPSNLKEIPFVMGDSWEMYHIPVKKAFDIPHIVLSQTNAEGECTRNQFPKLYTFDPLSCFVFKSMVNRVSKVVQILSLENKVANNNDNYTRFPLTVADSLPYFETGLVEVSPGRFIQPILSHDTESNLLYQDFYECKIRQYDQVKFGVNNSPLHGEFVKTLLKSQTVLLKYIGDAGWTRKWSRCGVNMLVLLPETLEVKAESNPSGYTLRCDQPANVVVAFIGTNEWHYETFPIFNGISKGVKINEINEINDNNQANDDNKAKENIFFERIKCMWFNTAVFAVCGRWLVATLPNNGTIYRFSLDMRFHKHARIGANAKATPNNTI